MRYKDRNISDAADQPYTPKGASRFVCNRKKTSPDDAQGSRGFEFSKGKYNPTLRQDIY